MLWDSRSALFLGPRSANPSRRISRARNAQWHGSGSHPGTLDRSAPIYLYIILYASVQVPRREKVDIISVILSMVAEGTTAKTHQMAKSIMHH
jgi:hypothetical protein